MVVETLIITEAIPSIVIEITITPESFKVMFIIYHISLSQRDVVKDGKAQKIKYIM